MATTTVIPSPDECQLQSLALLDYPPSTDFAAFITDTLAQSHISPPSPSEPTTTTTTITATETIDQNVLRKCINLSSSFLLTDITTNPSGGISSWSTGLNRLVDIVIVLHIRNELEADTISAASQACSECWTIAGSWRGLDDCRQRVREVGGRLKKILDPNERTYRGQRVYAP